MLIQIKAWINNIFVIFIYDLELLLIHFQHIQTVEHINFKSKQNITADKM